MAEDPDVASVTDPFTTGTVSADERIARSTVTYALNPLDVDAADREALFAAAEPGRDAGLQVEFSGDAPRPSRSPAAAGELLGVAVAALVLLVTFGSLVAAGLPLLTALARRRHRHGRHHARSPASSTSAPPRRSWR